MDNEAKALVKLLEGFDDFNMLYLSEIDKTLKGKRKSGANIVEQHFQKKANRGGNLPALEPSTLKRKKDNRKLVVTGNLKAQTLKPKKPKIRGNKAILRAKVDEYGKHLTDGIPSKSGKKVYNFFNIFKNEMSLFDSMAQKLFDFLLLSKGVK
jgi:hypothetical protein